MGTTLLILPRLSSCVTIKQRRGCTIRSRIFVLRTQIIPENTAGTLKIRLRSLVTHNGKGQVVMAIIIVVYCVLIPIMKMIGSTKYSVSVYGDPKHMCVCVYSRSDWRLPPKATKKRRRRIE